LWTQLLAETAARVLAIDASPEAIAINRERLQAPHVDYCVTDIFSWAPETMFDFVFFSFWLSHVPASRFDLFWQAVRKMLRPQGQAFFIDSLLEPTSTARDHEAPDDSGVIRRRLNDQREFHIVKVFHDPSILQRRLNARGWQGWVRSSGRFFLYGSVGPMHDKG
jgi:demethylmenaquinone methyltransferase/2-methoxy-6-polyprenyl-1,4-benzoquinol methylase